MDARRAIVFVSRVLPLRVNSHVASLIDRDAAPDDPIFRLVVPD